jgi:hypothetical protein
MEVEAGLGLFFLGMIVSVGVLTVLIKVRGYDDDDHNSKD